MPRTLLPCIAAALLLLSAAGASADTLQRIRDTGQFRIGYRTDAAPLSFRNSLGEASGYSVALCREIALTVKDALGLTELPVSYVPVTAEGRFEAVADGEVDILCGAATITLARRRVVDFSIPTFIDGASVLFRADGPSSFDQLSGRKVGVRLGTTTEQALVNTLADTGISAEVVPVGDHADGLRQLESGAIAAYFADRSILAAMLAGSGAQEQLRLSQRFFTYEPHGLALALNDAAFRLLVDTTLARLYSSGLIESVFRAAFGERAKPGDLLLALYVIHSLGE